jgi:exodeoxyribonuclease VII small subunit
MPPPSNAARPTSSPPPKPTPLSELTFEQALDELDTLVRRMESGELGLDDSIAAYRRGAELATWCQARLAVAEQEIKVLDGEVLKTLDPDELRGAGQ